VSRKFLSRKRQSGFSLVEVVLAVGVISFAFVAILGLLPAGLTQFRQAMDNSVASQIAQRIILEAQQSDFDVFTETNPLLPNYRKLTELSPFTKRVFLRNNDVVTTRYFDEQGNEVVPQSQVLTAKELSSIIYHVNTRVSPNTSLPGSPADNSDLGTAGAGYSLATILVQVAFNPSGQRLKLNSQLGSPNYLMIDTSDAKMKVLPIRNYNAQIGRND